MMRIKIKDLPSDTKIDKNEMKNVLGGYAIRAERFPVSLASYWKPKRSSFLSPPFAAMTISDTMITDT